MSFAHCGEPQTDGTVVVADLEVVGTDVNEGLVVVVVEAVVVVVIVVLVGLGWGSSKQAQICLHKGKETDVS